MSKEMCRVIFAITWKLGQLNKNIAYYLLFIPFICLCICSFIVLFTYSTSIDRATESSLMSYKLVYEDISMKKIHKRLLTLVMGDGQKIRL